MSRPLSRPAKNTPALWRAAFPVPRRAGNKYDRGHCIVLGGPLRSTGAAQLAATAALRAGAGLVSVACDRASLPVYAAALQAVMTKPAGTLAAFDRLVSDSRVTAVLLGPGAGVSARTKSFVLKSLARRKPAVLDADALSVFEGASARLFKAIASPCILTPHEGEFSRLFPDIKGNRLARARAAAARSGAVVVLKGSETVIAAPDGRAAVNAPATPYLATAGTGDVLAGLCAGLLAQGMDPFKAACAAVWLQAEAARTVGAGLIAEDLPDILPDVLRRVLRRKA